jgi:hypothetical protein
MKKFKNIFPLIYCLLIFSNGNTQNILGSSDDIARIALNAYVPEQAEKISGISSSLLANKLNQIATQNGMGGNGLSNRFIITANINVLTKDITPTAPPMFALTLEVTFYVGDGIEGTKFASSSVTVQGVGTNETKAYIDALKNIKPSDPTLQTFLANAKKNIIEYYNSNCDMIIKEAQSYDSQNNSDAAIFTLSQVPKVCKDCYTKALSYVAVVYKKQQERDCKIKLNQAEATWAAKPTVIGAEEVATILSKIDPETDCYKKSQILVKKIIDKVEKEIKKTDDRNWKIRLLETTSSIEIQKQAQQNIRDISIAYANNQPKVIYNVRGWW